MRHPHLTQVLEQVACLFACRNCRFTANCVAGLVDISATAVVNGINVSASFEFQVAGVYKICYSVNDWNATVAAAGGDHTPHREGLKQKSWQGAASWWWL